MRDLLKDGYIAELRSVQLHIRVEYFQRESKAALHFNIPPENFSSLISIYSGPYFDAVFTLLILPDSVSARTNQTASNARATAIYCR